MYVRNLVFFLSFIYVFLANPLDALLKENLQKLLLLRLTMVSYWLNDLETC